MTNPLQGPDEETPKPLTPEERRRLFVERANGRWLAAEQRGWNDVAKYELLSRYEATVDSLESALRDRAVNAYLHGYLDSLNEHSGTMPLRDDERQSVAEDAARAYRETYWPADTGKST